MHTFRIVIVPHLFFLKMLSRIDHIQKMLADEPNDPFLRYALALELARDKQLTKAIEQVEKLIQDQEQYLPAYYQLGKWYEQAGNHTKAVETFRKGIEIAHEQGNHKTLNELQEALFLSED